MNPKFHSLVRQMLFEHKGIFTVVIIEGLLFMLALSFLLGQIHAGNADRREYSLLLSLENCETAGNVYSIVLTPEPESSLKIEDDIQAVGYTGELKQVIREFIEAPDLEKNSELHILLNSVQETGYVQGDRVNMFASVYDDEGEILGGKFLQVSIDGFFDGKILQEDGILDETAYILNPEILDNVFEGDEMEISTPAQDVLLYDFYRGTLQRLNTEGRTYRTLLIFVLVLMTSGIIGEEMIWSIRYEKKNMLCRMVGAETKQLQRIHCAFWGMAFGFSWAVGTILCVILNCTGVLSGNAGLKASVIVMLVAILGLLVEALLILLSCKKINLKRV